MFSLISADRRTLRLSTLALVGAVTLAACDNDRTVGPSPATTAPTTPSLAKGIKNGTLTITIVDQNATPVTTLAAQFTVASSAGGPAFFAVDNAPSDANSTIGTIQMNGLASGKYEVCQTVAPTDYVLPATTCQTVLVGGIVPAQLTFVDLTVGHVKWAVVDFLQHPLGGAVIKVHDGISWSMIADNSALDLDPALGRFEVKAPNGSYSICPDTPPAGWVFMSPYCIGMPAPAGQTTDFGGFGMNPEYSVYFYATDYDGPIGPSEYLVTSADGTFSAKLVDDGANDMWTGALGKLWIQLPADGDYTICQTVAPPKMNIADPSCKRVTIKLGVLEYAGIFVSQPL